MTSKPNWKIGTSLTSSRLAPQNPPGPNSQQLKRRQKGKKKQKTKNNETSRVGVETGTRKKVIRPTSDAFDLEAEATNEDSDDKEGRDDEKQIKTLDEDPNQWALLAQRLDDLERQQKDTDKVNRENQKANDVERKKIEENQKANDMERKKIEDVKRENQKAADVERKKTEDDRREVR